MVSGKYLNFIKSNIRSSKYQVFSVALLFVVASMLINTFLFLSFNYNSSFFREKERLNGEDVDMVFVDGDISSPKEEKIAQVLSDIPEIKEFEVDKVVANTGNFNYRNGKLSRTTTYMNVAHAKEKQVGMYEILEESGESGAYLSYQFKVDGGYKIGDEITVTMGIFTDTFKIAGFYNNVDTGTMNCSDVTFLLTEDLYDEVSSRGINSYRVSVVLDEPDEARNLESNITHKVRSGVPSLVLLMSSTALRLATARYITSSVMQAIISLTSVLIIGVVLAIIAITLTNYIRNNMKKLGAMKAMGYTSANLIIPIVLEFSAIALFTSAVGVAVSYAVFPTFNSMLEAQVGIPYHLHFMLKEALISVGICVVTASITSLVSVMKIKSITPIMAIRDAKKKSSQSHFLALDKTRFGLNTALSLKSWAAAKVGNIVIILSVTAISFVLGFSCFVYQSMVTDKTGTMTIVFGTMADSFLSVNSKNEEELRAELENNGSVAEYYMLTSNTVTPDGMPKLISYMLDDAEKFENDTICIKGHIPKNENEIAINGAYAKKNNLKIGDTLTFSDENEESVFTVCGLTQGASASGNECYLHRSGISRILPITNISYYVNLKDGVDIDSFNDDVASRCNLTYCYNYLEMTETSSATYMKTLTVATVAVVFISLLIAIFILYILISINLADKRRDHGILKSLGFVTKDIIYQTVVSIMPSTVLATVAGLWLSRSGAAMLFSLALNNIGVFSIGSPTKVSLLALAGICITVFTVGYSVILSNSVRHITPHQLFNNE